MTAHPRPTHPRPTHIDSGCWPSRTQERLLDALVGPPEDVARAYAVWRSEVSLDALDTSSFKLLPMLYRRLVASGVEVADMARLKGVYRHAWAQNQVLLRAAAGALQALERHAVPTMVLKGGALAVAWYGDVGTRPMADVDVLVPPDRAPLAMRVLADAGWRPRFPAASVLNDAYHGVDHRDPSGNAIDLHWYVGPDAGGPGADAEEWDASAPLSLMGAATRAPCATDLLMHVVVHGLRWSPVAPIRWVADAMRVLEVASADLDWERLVRRATERTLTLTLSRGLGYLATRFGAPVPRGVLDALAAAPSPRWEQVELALKTRPRDATVWGPLALLWLRHRRVVPQLGPLQRTLDFPRFARARLRADTWGDVGRGLAFQLRRQLQARKRRA